MTKHIEIIDGKPFTDVPRYIQLILILSIALLAMALFASLSYRETPRDGDHWVDPADTLPKPNEAVIGIYLIDGRQEPIRVTMFYNFDKNLNKLEWWCIDNEYAQVNLGRPYRWTSLLNVPDILLWSTIRDNQDERLKGRK